MAFIVVMAAAKTFSFKFSYNHSLILPRFFIKY